MAKGQNHKAKSSKSITSVFQRWLVIGVVAAFIISGVFTTILQYEMSEKETDSLLSLNITDIVADVSDASDANLLERTHEVAEQVWRRSNLQAMARDYDVTEINVVDKNGIITRSSNMSFVGFDMASGAQSAEFLVLLDGTAEYVQPYQPISYDASTYMKYAGAPLADGGFVQVGYNADRFQKDIAEQVSGATKNRHVGRSGFAIIADENWNIVSDQAGHEGMNLDATGIWIDVDTMPAGERFAASVYDEPSYCMYEVSEGYYIVSVVPQSEILLPRYVSIGVALAMEGLVFIGLFILISFLVRRLVIDNINKVNEGLSSIADGNLDVTVDVRASLEFSELSDDINTTVDTLKGYIAQEAARLDEELEVAKVVQFSTLPSVFPAFPDRHDFDIYASMHTAKEVGGDFYDFFFLNHYHLAILMADVSGKGITAAMFMMKAKTLIKSFATSEGDPAVAFTLANEGLCEGNDAEMFVTAWLGIINLKTGVMEYANAGHNPPIIMKANGEAEYLKNRSGPMLAAMEGMKYRKHTLNLAAGDRVYLYTDGVTEATDIVEELYGESRLADIMNASKSLSATELCQAIKEDVDRFAGEAPQFDDITMLCFDYTGRPVREMIVKPNAEETLAVTDFVEESLTQNDVPLKAVMKMNIAVDEIFSNIVKFANASYVKVTCYVEDSAAHLVFEDDGAEYNPLEQEEPDITLSAEDREIGGLGIFMVKKSMTEMNYDYADGKNILTMKLAF